jgi:hypothetical protein
VFEEGGGPRVATAQIVSFMFLVALTGCATTTPPDPSPWHWQKAGATIEQQRRDQTECATVADRAFDSSTLQDITLRAAASTRCSAP